MLPMEAFLTTGDTSEMRLVTQIFEFAKSIAEMQLSEMALSLYCAYILLQEGWYPFIKHSYCILIFCEQVDMKIK